MPASSEQQKTRKTPRIRFGGFSGAWEEKKLGEVLSMVVDNRGKTPPVESSGTPLLEVNSLGEKYIDYSKVKKYVNEETYKNWFRKHLQPSDVLFSTVGATALCSFYTGERKATVAQNIVGLRFRNENSHFMFYLLTEKKNNHKFKRIEMGAVQPSVKVSQMVKIKFSLPSLPEQQKIAGFLGAVDAWIQNLRAQKASLETYKKGMMQKIFSHGIRFRDDTGKNFPDWEEKKLGEVEDNGLIELGRGDVISKKDIARYPGKYPIYSSSVQNGGLFGNYGKYMFDEELVTWSVDGGGHFFYRPKHKFSITNVSGWMRIVSKSLNCKFVAFQLQYLHEREVFDYSSKAHPSVIRGIYKLKSPVIEEQQKIADFLTSLDNAIESKQRHITLAEEWKKGLMQGLFV